MCGREWFLFLYFKYWYFHSLKRFWDCDFNYVNVLDLHHSMEERYSIDLAFHFSFNQNKLWTNCRSKGLFYTTNPVFYTGQSVRWKPMLFRTELIFTPFVRRTGMFGNLWILLTHKPVCLLTCDILEVRGRFYWPGPSGLWLNSKTVLYMYISEWAIVV